MLRSFRSNIRTPAQESDSPLPPIHERLAYLHPSGELLEFYRQKMAQFDREHEELLQMLAKYKAVTDDQVKHAEEANMIFRVGQEYIHLYSF